jgi:hypothetical protein
MHLPIRMLSIVTLGLILTATPAVAKPGRPGRGDGATCPTDVAASLAGSCPCEGRTAPDGTVTPWRNHGQYVSCVARARNQLRRQGCLPDELRRIAQRCAAKSTCGKADAVLCCVITPGACVGDPMPGDGTSAGTCADDATRACDADAHCATATGPTLASSADACTARGGTPSGSGSVCTACPLP